ncbi:MAG: putative cytokinetic ring protein SteA, partial [Phycicoccus sp.]
ARHRPDLIVGDMDSVSDDALRSGAEIVVHAYRDGRAPGLERVRSLGVEPVVFPATGTSEDVAMLLADDKGATLIVAVGTHVTLVEFLDKGRSGMASTFLTRLRVGGKLVDAKGVSRLYRARISVLSLVLMLLVGVFALVAALYSTDGGRALVQVLGAQLDDLWSAVQGVFG